MNYNRRNTRILQLQPSAIRFTQDSVAMYFQDKHEVNETCEEIALGKLQVNQLPKIRVKFQNGKYFSVDNRRLYIFRVLEKLDFLFTISVFEVDEIRRDITTENNGCHVKIRSRPVEVNGRKKWQKVIIYRHCSCTNAWKGTAIPDWWDSNRKCHRNFSVIVPNPSLTTNDFPKLHQINKINTFKTQEKGNARMHGVVNHEFIKDPPNTNPVRSNYYSNLPRSKYEETFTPQLYKEGPKTSLQGSSLHKHRTLPMNDSTVVSSYTYQESVKPAVHKKDNYYLDADEVMIQEFSRDKPSAHSTKSNNWLNVTEARRSISHQNNTEVLDGADEFASVRSNVTNKKHSVDRGIYTISGSGRGTIDKNVERKRSYLDHARNRNLGENVPKVNSTRSNNSPDLQQSKNAPVDFSQWYTTETTTSHQSYPTLQITGQPINHRASITSNNNTVDDGDQTGKSCFNGMINRISSVFNSMRKCCRE